MKTHQWRVAINAGSIPARPTNLTNRNIMEVKDTHNNREIAKLKQAMTDNDPRGRFAKATDEEKRIWFRSYDALEMLLGDEDFEDFMDILDGI